MQAYYLFAPSWFAELMRVFSRCYASVSESTHNGAVAVDIARTIDLSRSIELLEIIKLADAAVDSIWSTGRAGRQASS